VSIADVYWFTGKVVVGFIIFVWLIIKIDDWTH
jgi:hypothetical protein